MIYKIYKIIDNTNGNVYVGQTRREVRERICNHKSDFNAGNNCSSVLILKNNDWKYELIEETDDITREKYWIQNSINCINKKRFEGRDKEWAKQWGKQYKENNKEKIREKKRIYNQKNKDKIKIYDKKRRDNQREQIRIYDRKKYEWYKSWGGRGNGLHSWNNNSLLRISPDVFN